MVQSAAKTVDAYISSLPADRKKAIQTVRRVILDNLPAGYEEGMTFGMIGYYIPLSRFPDTYNGQPAGIVALASQKQYMSLYLMVYADPKREKAFKDAWKKSGKKLDMGKSCLRFKSVDDLALDVIANVVRAVAPDELIAIHEKSRAKTAKGSRPARRSVKRS
jgi:hypothetical protein